MRRKSSIAFGLLAALSSSSASAAVVWVGDFETGDLSQYNFVLNGEINDVPYINLVADPVAQGKLAAQIELHNDAVWGNGLKRVELQHSPAAGRTSEGQTTYFAWSTDPSLSVGLVRRRDRM